MFCNSKTNKKTWKKQQKILLDLLKANNIDHTHEYYNSTNDWGFGGYTGTLITISGFKILIGKAHFRHAPSEKFIALYEGSPSTYNIVHKHDYSGHRQKSVEKIFNFILKFKK